MTDITTLADVQSVFGVTHLDHLDTSAEVPVVTADAPAMQGDVAIVPANGAKTATTPIPAAGVAVVRGENGGNTHALYSQECYFDAANPGNDLSRVSALILGTLTVPEGKQALLSHPEHGGLLIAPGTYEMRRQREQRDVAEYVRD